jgi:predicted nucleic acid-binding protein
MLVVDASTLVEMIYPTASGLRLIGLVDSIGGSMHAPELMTIEVLQVLRKHERMKLVNPQACDLARKNLFDMDVEMHTHDLLAPRVWKLRKQLSAYDASYVALAELLGCKLLTMDQKLARSAVHVCVDLPKSIRLPKLTAE